MGLIGDKRTDRLLKQARKRIRVIPDPVLNEICQNVQDQLAADSAFVSFVGSGAAFIVGANDMPPEFLKPEGMMLNASFCAALVNSAAAEDGIVSENTRTEPMLKYCPTTALYGAWVGAPIHYKDRLVGAIGAATHSPHEWPRDALSVMFSAAELVEAEINY